MMGLSSISFIAFVMPFGSSSGDLGLVFFIFLLLFGAKKLPEMARTLGKFMEHLRRASQDFKSQLVEADQVVAETRKDLDVSRDLAMDDSSNKDAGWSDPYAGGPSDDEDPWGALDYDEAELEPDEPPAAGAPEASAPVETPVEEDRGV